MSQIDASPICPVCGGATLVTCCTEAMPCWSCAFMNHTYEGDVGYSLTSFNGFNIPQIPSKETK